MLAGTHRAHDILPGGSVTCRDAHPVLGSVGEGSLAEGLQVRRGLADGALRAHGDAAARGQVLLDVRRLLLLKMTVMGQG